MYNNWLLYILTKTSIVNMINYLKFSKLLISTTIDYRIDNKILQYNSIL